LKELYNKWRTRGGGGIFKRPTLRFGCVFCQDPSSLLEILNKYFGQDLQIIDENEKIRNIVLIQLYKKYYEDGFAHPIDTEEVVLDAGIPSENSNLAYTNVIYLAESSLIKGDKPLDTKYPKWISIKPCGIERVEGKEKEFAKVHNDIRFKILSKLYDYNFTDHEDHTIPIDINFTKSLGLNESHQNLVIGDINYLYYKGLIKGLRLVYHILTVFRLLPKALMR
jgi:hypothetical protein